jgi:protein-tyrosine phosphatase
LTDDELYDYGVEELFEAYDQAGFVVRRMPILDQSVSTTQEMRTLITWLREQLNAGHSVTAHCVGGLGRAGVVAASVLRSTGLDADAAVEEIRRIRSPRALESKSQEQFVRDFDPCSN